MQLVLKKRLPLFQKGCGVRSNPPFWSQCTCEMKNDSNSVSQRGADDWSRNLLTQRVLSNSSLVLMLLGGRGKAIHNNDETDTTYAPHRGSDVLMSFLTPFWMYCKYYWWCWKRTTFEIRCDLAHHGCQDRQDLWIRTVLTAAVDSAYFFPSNKVWCLIWPLDEEWSSSSCHIFGIDSQCTSLWCVRHETSGILCYQAKGARAIAFFCPPANRPHWATACREAHDVL